MSFDCRDTDTVSSFSQKSMTGLTLINGLKINSIALNLEGFRDVFVRFDYWTGAELTHQGRS